MITHQTSLRSIHNDTLGVVFIKLELTTYDEGVKSSHNWHQFSLAPTENVSAVLSSVNTGLEQRGGAALSAADMNSVTTYCASLWTPAMTAAYVASQPPIPTVADLVTRTIAKTYADVDALYATAVGNRAEEYRQAEAAALAYQAAGYSGAVSEYVSSWAASNPPMTNAQSADVIIARAAALRSAMAAVRTQRFVSQAAMRAATTRAELDTAVAAWDAFVAATRTALA